MYTRITLLILSLGLAFFVIPGSVQAQTTSCSGPTSTPGEPPPTPPFSCSNTFSQGITTGIFDFSGTGDGIITFQFDTVITGFTLTVTATEISPAVGITNVAGDLTGATCIFYSTNGMCVRYDVTGDVPGGPNGTPIRGVQYRGLITVTLDYNSDEVIQIPVFGHDPELDPNFDENILTSYVDPSAPDCTSCDPTMGGKTPGISNFAAFTEHFANGGSGLSVCASLTVTPQTSTSGNNPIEEVTFQLASPGNCNAGPFLRDKTATLTVASVNSGKVVLVNLVNGGDANKFHFDNKNGTNVQDINTNGLPSGAYVVTVISTQFSPVTARFTIP